MPSLIYFAEFYFLGAAHSAYCHSEAISQEAIRNTGAGPTGLELGHTGERASGGMICAASDGEN